MSPKQAHTLGTKMCTKCGVEQDEENFSWKIENVRRSTQCKTCHKEYRRTHYLNNREKYLKKANQWNRDNHSQWGQHRLTEDEFSEMREGQNNRCAICREQKEIFVVDHDHECCPGRRSCGGCVRGLLCRNCNSMIGFAKDQVDILENAITYLKLTGEPTDRQTLSKRVRN